MYLFQNCLVSGHLVFVGASQEDILYLGKSKVTLSKLVLDFPLILSTTTIYFLNMPKNIFLKNHLDNFDQDMAFGSF